MKTFLLAVFLSIAAPALAQDWKRVPVDSVVSVLLPKEYTKSDTLNQQIISSKTFFGNIQVYAIPDSPKKTPDIEKTKHLKKYYNNYIKSITAASKGKVSKAIDTVVGKLQVKDFTLQTYEAGGAQLRKFRVMHENCATYVFQYIYYERQKDVAQEECKRFFNSIEVANTPTLASQFTTEVALPKKRFNALWISIPVVLISIAVILVNLRRIRNRRKKA